MSRALHYLPPAKKFNEYIRKIDLLKLNKESAKEFTLMMQYL